MHATALDQIGERVQMRRPFLSPDLTSRIEPVHLRKDEIGLISKRTCVGHLGLRLAFRRDAQTRLKIVRTLAAKRQTQ